MLGATAVAFKDVPAGAQVWGNPAQDKTTEIRAQATLRKLPQMAKDLRAVKERLGM